MHFYLQNAIISCIFTSSNNNNLDLDFGPTPAEALAAAASVPVMTESDVTATTRAMSAATLQTSDSQSPRRQVRPFRPPQQRRSYQSNNSERPPRSSNVVPPLPETVVTPPRAPELSEDEREALTHPVDKFEELMGQDTNGGDGITDNLLRGIYANGFERPSIIQAQAIRPVLSGQDVIAQAQSGMGKTGAFCIGTLGRINTAVNTTQAVVLAHTRELATQIETVFRKIASNTAVRITTCIGGSRPHENVAALTGNGTGQRPHIVIGTPGRMIDMLTRKDRYTSQPVMDTRGIKMLVIDEADAMLGTTTEAARSANRRQQ